MEKRIKYILFTLILIILVLPGIQSYFDIIDIKPLNGNFIPAPKPELNAENWYAGIFQLRYDDYLEENIGFRNWLVRLNNQLDFTLFGKPNAEGVVAGKNGHMFEKDYIRSYMGWDFIGEKLIDKKLRRLKFIQNYLKDEKDVDLIFILEPGKASYYPEYFPPVYDPDKKSTSNYDVIVQKAGELDIKLLDLNNYFREIKGRYPYPFYTKYGVHWSLYSVSFAIDTMAKFFESARQINLPGFETGKYELTTDPRDTDNDVSVAMNLIFQPAMDTMAYPVYRLKDNGDTQRPTVLAVGDSYYFNIFNTVVTNHIFEHETFWYFYDSVYPDSYTDPKVVEALDIINEVEKRDIVLLAITQRNYHHIDWGFIDDLFAAYGPTSIHDEIYLAQNSILRYEEWFDNIIEDARSKRRSIEQELYRNALFLLEKSDPQAYFSIFGPEHFVNQIYSDSSWLEDFMSLSRKEGIPVDTLIDKYARERTMELYPEALDRYYSIRKRVQELRHDSARMQEIREKARYYHLTADEMLYSEAERMYLGGGFE